MYDITTLISLLIAPLSSVVTWIVARRARNNNMLCEMQKTIDMLVKKNQELYNEVVELRNKLADYGIK